MAVRKTEARIPTNFQAADLGQSTPSADGRCTLISFTTAPIVVQRENDYVLFVTDAALAAAAQSYEWTFKENDDIAKVSLTPHGEVTYRPQSLGMLSLVVRILDAGGTEQAHLALEQEVVLPSAEVEALIADARDKPGPGAANPEVLRELVNEHSRYYHAVKLQVPETGDAFERFAFSIIFDGVLRRPPAKRKQHIDQLAVALNEQPPDFITLAAEGVGVSGIRLALLAMTLPRTSGSPAALLAWTELPEAAEQRTFADEKLRRALGALDETTQINLFNLARFPKSNITQCGRILETLRDHYFPGKNFNDVLTRMSGTLAYWITRHYREGPLLRS
jgi:hypothetical protein